MIYNLETLRICCNLMGKSSLNQLSEQYKLSINSLQDLQLTIKRLKTQQLNITQSTQNTINTHLQYLISYMSQQHSYNQQHYLRSIILLQNILVLRKELLYSLTYPESLLQNLNSYFISIFKFYNSTQFHHEEINNLLYTCCYFVVLLIYNAGRNKNKNYRICQILINREFVSCLGSIHGRYFHGKMGKIVTIILLYIVRNRSQYITNEKIKKLVLQLIYYNHEEISKIHLILILRKICMTLKSSQVHQYKLLQFIFNCLKLSQSTPIKNALTLLNFILTKYKQFTQEIINMQLMKYWDANVKQFPQLCLNIFKKVIHFIPNEKKQIWFKIYLKHIINHPQNTSHFHILILQNLIQFISPKTYLDLLQTLDISKIKCLKNRNYQKMELAINKFNKQLQSKLGDIDFNLLSTYVSAQHGVLQQSFHDLY